MPSKKLKKRSKRKALRIESYGTAETYWPFQFGVTRFTQEDIDRGMSLTPSQRVEWLVMMQQLLIDQFSKK